MKSQQAQFVYEARTSTGTVHAGTLTARSREEATRQLIARNLFVTRISVRNPARSARRSTAISVSHTDVAWFINQLSVMVDTGIPLSEALGGLACQARNRRLRSLLDSLSTEVASGTSLSDAMRHWPRAFGPGLVAIVRAAEETGTMGRCLNNAAEDLMRQVVMTRKLRAAMTYPILMLLLCGGVIAALLCFVLPRFVELFSNNNQALPLPTRFLIGISEHLSVHWPRWVIFSATAAAISWIVMETTVGKRARDTAILSMPVISKVFHSLYQARSFRSFSMMIGTGVPMLQAVSIVRGVVPNLVYEQLWNDVAETARRGDHMADAFARCHAVSPHIAQMISSGERSGRLAMVFERLATYAESEHESVLRALIQMIEPCMILILGALVGGIAAALMLPLFQASQVVAS